VAKVAAGGFECFRGGFVAAARIHLGGQFSGQALGAACFMLEIVAGLFQPLGSLLFASFYAGGGGGQVAAGVINVEDLPGSALCQPGFVVTGSVANGHAPGLRITFAGALPFFI
jgi:hypothetical protein